MGKKEKVFYIAAECKPFSMVGGVGDVAGELPNALHKHGFDVEIITPGYSSIDRRHITGEARSIGPIKFRDADGELRSEPVEIRTGRLGDVKVHFVMNATYFEGPDYGKPYVRSPKRPFWDDNLRFSFFSKAILPLIKEGNPDIVHVNDWPLGYLFGYMQIAAMHHTRVLSVHNIGYQGNVYKPWVQNWQMLEMAEHAQIRDLFNDPRAGVTDNLNPLRLALELAHAVNTVSPNYAKEMMEPRDDARYFIGGDGLEPLVRRLSGAGQFVGILNGLQYKSEPTAEGFAALSEEKKAAKKKFESYFRDGASFLVGFVGRAEEQKVKLLAESLDGKSVLEHILEIPSELGEIPGVPGEIPGVPGVNVAFLGTGDPEFEALFSAVETSRWAGARTYEEFLTTTRRGNIVSTIAFDKELARQIWLASDIFLVPSLYEPCGITQMQSMELATPPLVRRTGGLADTVVPYGRPDSTGFVFDGATGKNLLRSLVASVREARDVFRNNPAEFQAMRQRAYNTRFTWDDTAQKYAALYGVARMHNNTRVDAAQP
jgi:starch synthase